MEYIDEIKILMCQRHLQGYTDKYLCKYCEFEKWKKKAHDRLVNSSSQSTRNRRKIITNLIK